jgi:ATP-binding cassette, subfamily B (MDR/TAP), member 1
MSATTINTIGPHVVTFTRAGAAAVELFDLIDRKSAIDTFEASGQEPTTSKGNIELQNVSFSYPTRPDVRVLDDFSLTVPAGKVTALVVSYLSSNERLWC